MLPGQPHTLSSSLDFLLHVCIVLERQRHKRFGIKLSTELISIALEALSDPTVPVYLDRHSGCVSLQTQRRTPIWKSQREVSLQMLSDSQSNP